MRLRVITSTKSENDGCQAAPQRKRAKRVDARLVTALGRIPRFDYDRVNDWNRRTAEAHYS
jgi:hypothetical protein